MTSKEELRERFEKIDAEYHSPKYTYRVESLRDGEECVNHVECDTVEVSDGVVRFRLYDGEDVWGISTDRVLEYSKSHVG